MIYTLKIKKTDNTYIDIQIDYQDISIDNEVPCGIEYRKECSTIWDQSKQNQWWDLVDFALTQNNISLSDFIYVWNININGTIYGITNNPI